MNLFPSLFQKTFKFLPFLFAVVAIIIYYPSLSGEFIADDVSYFENDILTKLTPLDFKAIFLEANTYWGGNSPIRDYLFVLEFNLFGKWTTGYHIISLLLFLGSAFVLFYWVKELFGDFYKHDYQKFQKYAIPNIFASIVFVLFLFCPTYVEVVAYISDQTDLLLLLFVLLSIKFLYKVGKQTNKQYCLL